MKRASVLLLLVLILSVLGMICIAVGVATNAWLSVKTFLDPIQESDVVGLFKTCSKVNQITGCIDILMSTPITLILIGFGLLVCGIVTLTVILVFTRLLSTIGVLSIILLLSAMGFFMTFVAVYWYQMLNTLSRQSLIVATISLPGLSIGYSSILLFIGLGLIILSISLISFLVGSQVSASTVRPITYHYPISPNTVRYYSHF